MQQRFRKRKTFDPLGTPGCVDCAAWHTPDLFGVRLEERLIKFAAEAVDKELFERVLPSKWEHCALDIAETDTRSPRRAHLEQRVLVQPDGIFEQFPQEVDS